IFESIDDIEGVASDITIDGIQLPTKHPQGPLIPNPIINLKVGAITPLFKSYKDSVTAKNPLASFFLVSLQAGQVRASARPSIGTDIAYLLNTNAVSERLGLDYTGIDE